MTFDRKAFEEARRESAASMAGDAKLAELSRDIFLRADMHNYVYQWTWLGVPIIQVPPDIMMLQEIIWETKPDVIVETGIAWGGSIIFQASILALIGKGEVIGIDTVLPDKNRKKMAEYGFADRIHLIHGSSTDDAVVAEVKARIAPGATVMVVLDSNHTHDHVLAELRLYGPMVTAGSFLLCTDTIVETAPPQPHQERPWGPGHNPKTALDAYLKETDRFEPDAYVNAKPLITFSPGGFLRCIKDAA